MSLGRRIAFALLTFVIVFGAVEGVARIVWARLERNVLDQVAKGGEEALRNDVIQFLKEPSALYGYTLRPGEHQLGLFVSPERFFQRERVSRERTPGTLRILALGESTTMGQDLDATNYPGRLRSILAESATGYAGTEVINAGIAGWISDQLALRVEHELAAYRPDVVVLYVGWNDFQSYDPFRAPPTESYFEQSYGHRALYPFERLKSVALLRALRDRSLREARKSEPARVPEPGSFAPPAETYRFLDANLDRIVAAFRRENPSVVIAVSTLASRWPQGTPADFEASNGHVWWMKDAGVDPAGAAAALDRLNDFLRGYAREHDLLLIDVAAAYAETDRTRLFWDFAHMRPDGYELMAATIYEKLRAAGAIRGEPTLRGAAVTERYRLANH